MRLKLAILSKVIDCEGLGLKSLFCALWQYKFGNTYSRRS